MRSYDNYFSRINTVLTPYIEFSEEGSLVAIEQPIKLSKTEQKELTSYLWRISNNRKFKLSRYETIIKEIRKVEQNIEEELN